MIQERACAPELSARNLVWNATRAGQWARQACPEGASGRASWYCDPDRLRFTPTRGPDLSQCRSSWLARLAGQLDQTLARPPSQAEQAPRALLAELALLSRTRELFGEDLKRLELMLGQLMRAHAHLWPPVELLQRLAALVSSLLEPAQSQAWLELEPDQRQQLEWRLLAHLRDAGARAASGPMTPVRFANVFASVINLRDSPELPEGMQIGFRLDPMQQLGNDEPELELPELREPEPSEFRLQTALLRELMANGKCGVRPTS